MGEKTTCDHCGSGFDLQTVKAQFDHYYAGSADWKYDQVIYGRLCRDCADTDVENRWMAGTLEAADGPPPGPDEMPDVMKLVRRTFPR